MNSIIINLQQSNLNAPLMSSLDGGVLTKFNNIFSYNNKNIKVVGTVDNP